MSDPLIFVAIEENLRNSKLLSDMLPDEVGLKIGVPFLFRYGFDAVRDMADRHPIMIDAKLHDIPTTMKATIRCIMVALTPRFITVHAQDSNILHDLVDDLRTYDRNVDLVGVMHLSSRAPLGTWTMAYEDIKAAGIEHVIAPGWILNSGTVDFNDAPWPIAVGIRMSTENSDDHVHTMTPHEAYAAGARTMIIGRPITQAADPRAALRAVLASLDD